MGLKELLIIIAIVVFLLIVIFEWRLCVALSRNKRDHGISDEAQLDFIKEYKNKKEIQSVKFVEEAENKDEQRRDTKEEL